jgi:hypothetical protein
MSAGVETMSKEALAGVVVPSENVRFGSKADIEACPRDVRFTPKSGHSDGGVLPAVL